jgi:hypothetical protein
MKGGQRESFCKAVPAPTHPPQAYLQPKGAGAHNSQSSRGDTVHNLAVARGCEPGLVSFQLETRPSVKARGLILLRQAAGSARPGT